MTPTLAQIDAAIEYVSNNNLHNGMCSECGSHHDIAMYALRALRLLVDEPTEEMNKAGWDQHREDFHCNGRYDAARHFKAMRSKLLEMVEG